LIMFSVTDIQMWQGHYKKCIWETNSSINVGENQFYLHKLRLISHL
jgi:hypothetical protein